MNLQSLLTFDHSNIDALISTSHATAHKFIVDYYKASKPTVAMALRKA